MEIFSTGRHKNAKLGRLLLVMWTGKELQTPPPLLAGSFRGGLLWGRRLATKIILSDYVGIGFVIVALSSCYFQ